MSKVIDFSKPLDLLGNHLSNKLEIILSSYNLNPLEVGNRLLVFTSGLAKYLSFELVFGIDDISDDELNELLLDIDATIKLILEDIIKGRKGLLGTNTFDVANNTITYRIELVEEDLKVNLNKLRLTALENNGLGTNTEPPLLVLTVGNLVVNSIH